MCLNKPPFSGEEEEEDFIRNCEPGVKCERATIEEYCQWAMRKRPRSDALKRYRGMLPMGPEEAAAKRCLEAVVGAEAVGARWAWNRVSAVCMRDSETSHRCLCPAAVICMKSV